MKPEKAIVKVKDIMIAEMDRIPSHYDTEVEDEIYNDAHKVDEILKLNKVVCEALEKQIPKKPRCIGELDANDNAEVECECLATQEVAIKTVKQVYCWKCGQLLDLSDED